MEAPFPIVIVFLNLLPRAHANAHHKVLALAQLLVWDVWAAQSRWTCADIVDHEHVAVLYNWTSMNRVGGGGQANLTPNI